MQIQIFKISLEDSEGLEELNNFLRSHRILEVQQEFVGGQLAGYWSFVIEVGSGVAEFCERRANQNLIL